MAKWVEIFKNRSWKNPKIIDEEKIICIVKWGVLSIEIIYPHKIFNRSYMLDYSKDKEEFEYFSDLAKKSK